MAEAAIRILREGCCNASVLGRKSSIAINKKFLAPGAGPATEAAATARAANAGNASMRDEFLFLWDDLNESKFMEFSLSHIYSNYCPIPTIITSL